MAKGFDDTVLPDVSPMAEPPNSRIIPLDRQEQLTHQQIEQIRFGLGDTGPFAQAVMNSNVAAATKQIFNTGITCTSDRRPSDPVLGQMIYESNTKQILFWDGTSWVYPANSDPIGAVKAFAGSAAPTGYLLCSGSAVSRTTYAGLFAVISTTYGAGDGTTTFNVPDLRGRIPVGAGTGAQQGGSGSGVITGGTALTARTVGQWFGDERLQSHNHTQTSHQHVNSFARTTGAGADLNGAGIPPHNGAFNNYISPISEAPTIQSNGSGTSQNLQPSLVMNFIIKT